MSQNRRRRRRQSVVFKALAALAVLLGVALVSPTTTASAAESIWVDKYISEYAVHTTSTKPSITGGRAYVDGQFVVLRVQTLKGGTVQFQVEGSMGVAADHNHQRTNSANESCRWRWGINPGQGGSAWAICKYRY